jgi:hypothetical protein
MSYFNLSLRLYGELPDISTLNNFIGVSATTFHKKGDILNKKTQRIQPIDIWILKLTPDINSDSTDYAISDRLVQAEILLQNICLNISRIAREKISADLNISYTVDKVQDIFTLPAGLVSAADIAKLEINFSFLTMLSNEN